MAQDSRRSPRRSPRSAPTAVDQDFLADWERELLGLPANPVTKAIRKSAKAGPGSPRPRTRAEVRKWDRRALRLSGRSPKSEPPKRRPKTALKPKTAEAADYNRRVAETHRKGKLTRDFKPRKSRRSLKRELYSKTED